MSSGITFMATAKRSPTLFEFWKVLKKFNVNFNLNIMFVEKTFKTFLKL